MQITDARCGFHKMLHAQSGRYRKGQISVRLVTDDDERWAVEGDPVSRAPIYRLTATAFQAAGAVQS